MEIKSDTCCSGLWTPDFHNVKLFIKTIKINSKIILLLNSEIAQTIVPNFVCLSLVKLAEKKGGIVLYKGFYLITFIKS